MKQGWLIGELSHRVGLPSQTIRYYERLGLLDPPSRTESDYRIYSEASEERLRFIQKAKHFGLSLNEIKQLIDIRASGIIPCADLKVMVKQHLHDLERQIQEMQAFRQELAAWDEQIEALLPDSSTPPTEAICNGKICGLIENAQINPKSRNHETKNCSDC
ncbi:heavy metal-responsive transcriptional regulator [Fischerella thermalis]|uniref:heavy metal-responsive transcriptional regulator n=1 Tax=Fischerella thermalis TaxID=372787 RepID=UPI001A06630F|nr:heavy metal-responsive transcriptional regulator [Fischerella thermalis]MBF1989846.1 heavy metal-responsive transcriptional regulator [Fischerella thermalis M58_A2018_009]MBF2061149.1 heavy metal-responsive transcriptional regulator [Fischerella thermalis M66_A2018_004]MBF2069989.1 heavy metal-responsive transcriptional regulator [Fischerella thermalis M48_A2018_028]